MSAELQVVASGLTWPPETFLLRLFRRLGDHGIRLDVAGPKGPKPGEEPGIDWRPMAQGLGRDRTNLTALAAQGRRQPQLVASTIRRLAGAAGAGRSTLSTAVRHDAMAAALTNETDVLYLPWTAGLATHEHLLTGTPFNREVPVVVSCRGAHISVVRHNPRRRELAQKIQAGLARVDAIHCVSDAIAAEAVELGADPGRITVIRPAVDPDMAAPSARPAGEAAPVGGQPVRLITVGSLSWRKGGEYLLRALARASEVVDVELVFVGDGPDRADLVASVHDLGLASRVTFAGRQPPERVLAELAKADVFVLASLSEGISNAVLEAAAMALPVISTDCGGMAEFLTDGAEGRLVPTRDPAAMAAAIIELAQDPELRRRQGETGRATVIRQHHLDDQAQAFAELFRSVAQPTRTR